MKKSERYHKFNGQTTPKVNGQPSESQQSKLKEKVNYRMMQAKMTSVNDTSE